MSRAEHPFLRRDGVGANRVIHDRVVPKEILIAVLLDRGDLKLFPAIGRFFDGAFAEVDCEMVFAK